MNDASYLPIRHRRISRRLVFYIILASSFITLLTTIIQLTLDYQRDVGVIERNIKLIQESHLRSLENSVWVEDEQQIMSQLEGLVRYVDMEYLSISLNNNVVWSAGKIHSKRLLDRHFPLVHTYRNKEINIGDLRVVASIDSVISRLIDKAVEILISNALKTFIMAGVMFLLFHSLVARHLHKLGSWARTHSLADGYSPITLDRPKTKANEELDELDTVVGAMNEMQKSIVESYQKLHASHESKALQLQTVISSAPLAILSFDRNGVFMLAEGTALDSLGLNHDSVIGQSVFDVYSDYPEITDSVKRALSGRTIVFDSKIGERWFENHYSPKLNQKGKVLECIGVVVDITDRKLAEYELVSARDEARQANIALENSNKELESYSYSIAHDLRAPLRSIVGFSQLLLEDAAAKLEKGEKEHLDRIVKSATLMAELIDDILELSRVSRSQMVYKKVDLSAIFSEISESLKASDPDRVVEWRAQPNLVVHGDRHLLYLVMYNLMSNAWKFTQYKSESIIELGVATEDGGQVFYIRDNGAGFDMAYVDKLFGLFQRLHGSEDYEGTGVGLATVQRIISRHNGWVKAEGELGKGATVYFSIPRKVSASHTRKKKPELLLSN